MSLKAKDKAIRESKSEFLDEVVRDAKINIAQNRSIATGELIKSVKRDEDSAGSDSKYSGFVEFGTKTKVKIPSDPQIQAIALSFKGTGNFNDLYENIEKWAKNIGILDPGTVYKIAREIAEKGSSAKPFFYPAVFKNKIKLKRKLKESIGKRR